MDPIFTVGLMIKSLIPELVYSLMQIVDALAVGAEEGRGRLRKASGSCLQALIRRFPNGETLPCVSRASLRYAGKF